MIAQTLETQRGIRVRVLGGGPPEAEPVIFLHGLAGLLEDILDFALHGWDVVEALGLDGRRPSLVGHSMGGMIAAEMACLAPTAIGGLVLVDPFGLWLDESPIADIFALL